MIFAIVLAVVLVLAIVWALVERDGRLYAKQEIKATQAYVNYLQRHIEKVIAYYTETMERWSIRQ